MDELLSRGEQGCPGMALRLVGDGVQQVSLAKARRTVQNQRVVVSYAIRGDLGGGGVCELCVIADDKAVECELWIGPRADEV